MTDIETEITNSLDKDGQTVITGALDFNGNEIILDVDADTSIHASTDDQIDFKIGGVDELVLTAAKADNLDDIAAITPTDSNILVGDGTNWVAETGDTARTSLGLGTGDSPQFTSPYASTSIELGHATDSTITRVSAGLLAVEGDNVALVGTAQEYTRTQNFNATALTSTSNAVAWVASSNQVVTHTLTENTTFSAPSALVDGAFYNLAIIQDAGASSFTIAFNAVFKFTGGAAPTWTTTANARDYITFRSNGTNLYEVGHSLAVS